MAQKYVYRFEGALYREDGIALNNVREEWPSNNLAVISAVIWGSDEGFDIVKVYREENRNGERTDKLVANFTL